MCTYTLHEQYCRRCQTVMKTDHLDIKKCPAKQQQMETVRKRIQALVPGEATLASPFCVGRGGKARGSRTPSSSHMPQNMSEMPDLPSVPPPTSRVRGVKKWLRRQSLSASSSPSAQAQSPSPPRAWPGPSLTNAFIPVDGISFRQKQLAKRKADNLDADAKRHQMTMRQEGWGSAGPHPESDPPVPLDFLPQNHPLPLSPPAPVDAMDLDPIELEMSDWGFSGPGGKIDLDGDIDVLDVTYEDPEEGQGQNEEDVEVVDAMELDCVPTQRGVLRPEWGICAACEAGVFRVPS